jgi:hypothetical protein
VKHHAYEEKKGKAQLKLERICCYHVFPQHIPFKKETIQFVVTGVRERT